MSVCPLNGAILPCLALLTCDTLLDSWRRCPLHLSVQTHGSFHLWPLHLLFPLGVPPHTLSPPTPLHDSQLQGPILRALSSCDPSLRTVPSP